MRWSVVRLIAGKELRDLVRDRRTVLFILILPAVLYPLFGLTAFVFATALLGKQTVVGIVGSEHLPPATEVPPLFAGDRFADGLDEAEAEAASIVVWPLTGDPSDLLRGRKADAVLVIPEGFAEAVAKGTGRPTVKVLQREGDEASKLAAKRLAAVVRAWEGKIVEKRLADRGVPPAVLKPMILEDPQTDKPKKKKAADELRDTFTRVFPFILMMWLAAGAMQPAVDMTAGEKERGTMETLLISPADRVEIVLGKFLATTTFAFASVVWNVLWLTAGALATELTLGFPIVNLVGLVGCVVLGVPLAMFFGAVCLALGVFARSTKEGQYYLLPIILTTMPLAFWAMLPGTELDGWTAWVPVTGAMLAQQKLLSVSGDPIPWGAMAGVLAALAVWVAAALAFAAWQFTREQVLFRETGPERRGVLRKLFRRTAAPPP